jgi:hypothetical protein
MAVVIPADARSGDVVNIEQQQLRRETLMKKFMCAVTALLMPVTVLAQGEPAGKTLAATMDVFVFPTEGQDAGQQSQDEAACYEFANANTGSDPFQLAKQEDTNEQLAEAEKAAAQSTGQGAGARGAVRGAAAGALIGEIVDDDASEGAKYGAAAGAIRGRRQARSARNAAEQQAEQQAAAREEATAEDLENFKKAFSVCLEAKDYMVKY